MSNAFFSISGGTFLKRGVILLIKESKSLKQIETNYLKKGVYFLEIKCLSRKIYYKKIIKI